MAKTTVDSIVDDIFRYVENTKDFKLEDVISKCDNDGGHKHQSKRKKKKKKESKHKSKKSKKDKSEKRSSKQSSRAGRGGKGDSPSRTPSPSQVYGPVIPKEPWFDPVTSPIRGSQTFGGRKPSHNIHIKDSNHWQHCDRRELSPQRRGGMRAFSHSPPAIPVTTEKIESEEEDLADYATLVAKKRKVPIKAVKLSQYLKEKGHEAHESLLGQEENLAKQAEIIGDETENLVEEVEEAVVESVVEAFPLSKRHLDKSQTSKLKLPEKPVKLDEDKSKRGDLKFLPRNLKVTAKAMEEDRDRSSSVPPARKFPNPKEVLNREFNPPELKGKGLKCGSNEQADEYLQIGTSMNKSKEVKITFGKDLTKAKAIEFATSAPLAEPKISGEDGEIQESCASASASDNDLDDDTEDTEGELHDESAPETNDKDEEKEKEDGTPQIKKPKNKDFFSLTKKKRKKKEQSKSPSRKKKVRKYRSRSRSRSRSPYQSIRRRDPRYHSLSDRRSSGFVSHRRRGEGEGKLKHDFPWGTGGYATRRRERHNFSFKSSSRRSRSRSRSRTKRNHRSRSRSRSVSSDREKIDKKKLFKIAQRNASVMLKAGTLQAIRNMTSDELASLKSGGKTVDELVDYCKKIQRKEAKKEAGISDSEESVKGSDGESDFVRHPFEIKNNAIVLNIPNAVPIPIKTPLERKVEEGHLRLTFPVSSGSVHRDKEDEWTPVQKQIEAPKGIPMLMPPPPMPPPPAAAAPGPSPQLLSLPAPPPPPEKFVQPVFDDEIVLAPREDISTIVTERISCVKRLQDNANDLEALTMLHHAEEKLKAWAKSKNLPGQFTGSTGVQCLSAGELGPLNPKFQAWVKKDQLRNADAIDSGKGMSLLKKMGWNPGEGLGKYKVGSLEPLMLDLKTDRKGLVALDEMPASKSRPHHNFASSLQGKHPTSALMEICAKKNWGAPIFSCLESGGAHNRKFLWRVVVNGTEYQPACPHGNKKLSKAHTAQVALQSLGVLPGDATTF